MIAIATSSGATQVIRDATESTGQVPAWLRRTTIPDGEGAAQARAAGYRRAVAEQLIVELYSK